MTGRVRSASVPAAPIHRNGNGRTRSCWSAEGVGFEPTRNVTTPNGFQEHVRFTVHHGSYLAVQQLDPLRSPRSSRLYPAPVASYYRFRPADNP